MTEHDQNYNFDKAMHNITAVLQSRCINEIVTKKTKRQYTWRSPAVVLGIVALAILVNGTLLLARLLPNYTQPLQSSKGFAVSVQSLPQLTVPVASKELATPETNPIKVHLDDAMTSRGPYLQLAAQRKSRRPISQPRRIINSRRRSGSPYIANPLYGKELRIALIKDKEATRELNMRQLDGS